MPRTELHYLKPQDGIPNSSLPLVIVKAGLAAGTRNGDAACAMLKKNGWGGTWVYTVYPFWHFHTRGHEVLACVSGEARIGFGGKEGIVAEVRLGDVCVIPVGVGHKRVEASEDFLVAGGYPPGQEGNIVRPGEMDDADIAREVGSVPLPQTDPLSGATDGVVALWSEATGAAGY